MPSFTLEVPGEANPLTAQEVLKTLSRVKAGGQHNLQVASEQLNNWEKQRGYYSILQDIYGNLSLDESLRFQAIIQLKNGIDKHWRKTSPNAINKDEKLRIKSQAIEYGVREPAPALALQNALMVGKIARYEFPHDWPDAITILIGEFRRCSQASADPRNLSNAMVITLQVVKELASGRLLRTKKSLEQVALELLQVLGSIYVTMFEHWLGQLNTPDTFHSVNPFVRGSHLALKIIRRLLVAGFEHPHREKNVQEFWLILQRHQDSLWAVWPVIQQMSEADPDDAELVVRHLRQLSKIDLEMAKVHAASFVLLPNSMQVLSRSWSTINLFGMKLQNSASQGGWKVKEGGDYDDEASPLEKLALRALLILRACIKMVFNPAQTFKYQQPQDKADRKAAVETIRSDVLTDAFIIQIMEVLVTQYFVLRGSDLRDWEAEPDEWEKREEEIADAWEFSVRSCSEKLFLDVIINFKALLVPRLLQVFHQYADVSNTDIFLKESLYSAIGIAAACVEDKLDFNQFLRNTLIHEIQLNRPGYNLIRRRAAILLGQWVPIKPDILDRKIIYQIFAHLLNKEDKLNDVVVQVSAGRQLRQVLQPFEFNFDDFAPYATHIFESLMGLIRDAELSETKLALLETVRVAVSKLDDEVEPYADKILSLLPPLWDDSGEEHLMKQAILSTIASIVQSLGRKGLKYQSAFLPLIHDSVRPGSETMVYLFEDAVDLWLSVLQQAPSTDPPPTRELLMLIHPLISLLDNGSDSLRQVLDLVQSYILLSPFYCACDETVSIPLLTSLRDLLDVFNSSRPRDAIMGPHAVEMLVQAIQPRNISPADREQSLQALLTAMLSTGYFAALISLLQQAHNHHTNPRQSQPPPGVVGVGETSIFSILARLFLLNPQLTLQAIVTATSSAETPVWLLTEWLTHFDAIGDTSKKKLHCLGITSLLTLSSPPPPFVLAQLQSIMSMWTDVLTELAQDADSTVVNGAGADYLWQGPEPVDAAWDGETQEDTRERQLGLVDPVVVINARDYVGEVLKGVIASIGPEVFQREWLARVDEVVAEQFVALELL